MEEKNNQTKETVENTQTQNQQVSPETPKKRFPTLVVIVVLLFLSFIIGPLLSAFANAAVGTKDDPLISLVLLFLNFTPILVIIWLLVYILSSSKKPKQAVIETRNAETGSTAKTNRHALVKAIIATIAAYFLSIILAYATFGIILIPFEEWRSFSDPIPFVNTIHLIILSILLGTRVYQKNK